jgi:hypothetical protein
MTDLTPHPPDGHEPDAELLRRALEGEATPVELAAIGDDSRLAAELARQRRVVADLGRPVAPLSDSTVESMIARALDEGAAGTATDAQEHPRPTPDPSVTTITDRRDRRPDRNRRWAGWAAAAAAVVLLLGLGTVLVRGVSSSSSDTASSSADGGSAAPTSLAESATRSGGENATPESAGGDSSARSTAGANDQAVVPPTPVPFAAQLAVLTVDEVGAAPSIDALVEQVLAAPPTITGSGGSGEEGAAPDDLVACLDSRAFVGTVVRWARGTADGRLIDVIVLSRPGLGDEVLAIGPECTIERARDI